MNFLSFSIIALALTSFWVILYQEILNTLNYFYKPVVTETFYRPEAVWPEPYEMPLYILLSFLFTLGIIFFYRVFEDRWKFRLKTNLNKQTIFFAKLIIFIILLFSFLNKLGAFPLANDFYPYQSRSDKAIYILILTLYLGLAGFIIIQSIILGKIFKKKPLFTAFYYLFIILIIALFTFEPSFPSLPYEYSYFFGPIWDVIQGKTIFTNANSDYGFFSILFFAAFNKLNLFNFHQLPVFVWLMFVIQYFLCFYLVYKISNSLVLALLAVFAVITINYFSYPIIPITVPQYSAMRRLPAILLLFLLYKFRRMDSPYFLAAPAFFGFWIIDAGVSMYLALTSTLFLLFLTKYFSLKRAIRAGLTLFASLLFVFVLLNIVHIVLGYKPIDYIQLTISIRQYGTLGLTMIPLESRDIFWLAMLIYFASIIYAFRNSNRTNSKIQDTRNKQNDWDLGFERVILLAANLSFFNALYYVGRSHPANLIDISILILLNAFLLFGIGWRHIQSTKIKIILYFLLFLLFIAYPAYERRYTLTELISGKIKRMSSTMIFVPEMKGQPEKFFAAEKNLIRNHLSSKDVLILSRDDTYLFIVNGKRNLLRVNPQSSIDTVTEMKYAIKDVVSACPKKIAVDCTLYKRCPNFASYTNKEFFLAPYILNVLEKSCKTKYQPIECTNKLCITQAEN